MASTGEVWKLGHRPALDGVRGVAVLLVVVGHIWPPLVALGVSGVAMFFTLSGFLITSLLLEERAKSGRVSLPRFYVRRARRLFPAVAAFVLAFATLTVSTGFVWVTWGQAWPVLLYVQNWALIVRGESGGPFLHFWSLAVEEQFYLVWPVVMLTALRYGGRRVLAAVIAAGVVASVVAAVVLYDPAGNGWRVAYGSDTNAAGLLIGCALAVALHGGRAPRARPGLAAVAVAAVVVLGVTSPGYLFVVGSPALVGALTAAAIYCLAASDSSTPWANRVLVVVGKRSYGLYLWHLPLIALVLFPLGQVFPAWVAVPVYLGLTWGIVTLSWRYVEQPFLRRPSVVADAPAGSLLGLRGRVEPGATDAEVVVAYQPAGWRDGGRDSHADQ